MIEVIMRQQQLFACTLGAPALFTCGLIVIERGNYRLTDEGGIRKGDDNVAREIDDE